MTQHTELDTTIGFYFNGRHYRTDKEANCIQYYANGIWTNAYSCEIKKRAMVAIGGTDKALIAPLAPQKAPTQAGEKFGCYKHVSID